MHSELKLTHKARHDMSSPSLHLQHAVTSCDPSIKYVAWGCRFCIVERFSEGPSISRLGCSSIAHRRLGTNQ
jgi:hypothetical protein